MKTLSPGTVHTLPKDLHSLLVSDKNLITLWESLTPLARNEWICWIESAKLSETRIRRIQQTQDKLQNGKRRPCCWAGCSHR
jgi:uncharacterized protein YdeI (YjbR/CyaY-like superfamily)